MNRLAILLIGINVSLWILALGFAPRLPSCSYPTGDLVAAYFNCHETDRLPPVALAGAVFSVSLYLYRRPETKP